MPVDLWRSSTGNNYCLQFDFYTHQFYRDTDDVRMTTSLASGMLLASMSAELTARLSSYQVTELGGHAPLSSNTPNHQLGGLEPTLVNYPLSSEALHAPASDAKVRAYTKWLQGNVDEMPHFNMERV